MKKLITLAFALMCMAIAFAADNVDLIIKTNSEKIEALIQEVSDTEVKYKKANNPNGPLFVVKMEDISSIIYANGEVQAIEHKAAPAPQPQQNYGGYNGGYNNGFYAGSHMGFANGPMQRVGGDEYMIEGHRLKGRELNYFLQQNCPVAYTYHKKWAACEAAGWSLFSIGIVFAGTIGGGCWGWYANKGYNSAVLTAGVAFVYAGAGLVAGSIPLIVCGNVYKKRTANVFNQYCGRPQAFQPELHLTSGVNGLGLALSF